MERHIKVFFVLFLLAIVFFSFSTNLPPRQRGGFFSDEAGYFSIIQSIYHDADIQYTRQDLLRIKEEFPTGPVGVQLKKGTDGNIYYAKSFAFPLVAAPFYGLFGTSGILLLNGLMLFFACLMGYLLLKQYHPEGHSFSFALIFVFASVVPVYIWWMTADLFNFFVMFAGFFFFFYPFKRPRLFYISAIFFSLAAFSKPWLLAAIGIVYLALLYRKDWKRFVLLTLLSALVFGLFVGFLTLQTGEFSYKLYQGGERRQFTTCIPFDGPDCTWEQGDLMSFDNYWDRFFLTPHVVINNMFYFLFGRFTGMFIYFCSAFFLLVLFFFQPKEPEDWFVFAAIVTVILVFILLAPDNYFGGSGSIGNRYFFGIFPLFFFLGFKNRNFRFNLVPLVMALVFLPSIYMDSFHHATTARLSGISFPINLFPPEKTQYLSLPTNENPRARAQLIRSGDKKYQIFFLDDNYHTIENNAFWTNGSREVELLMVTPQKVKTFEITLNTRKGRNRVSFAIENKKKTMRLEPGRNYTFRLKKLDGIMMKGRYIYHVRVKSSQFYRGVIDNPEHDPDQRNLGVKTHIAIVY